MTTMLLKNLISDLSPDIAQTKIGGICFDTRNLKKGDLFVAIKGDKFDGNNYIGHAISKGAKVIIHSRPYKKNKKAKFLKFKDTRNILARISTRYYKKKPKNIIAVTGTNGKTSTSDFFNQIFTLEKKHSGFIGTLGFRKNKILKRRDLTTLDSLSINKDLEEMKRSNLNNVIIEASSHGLKQKRLDFLNIKAGIFTNLSHDHLDYHKSMRDYLNSKLLLFNYILRDNGTIITDTDIKEFKDIKKIQKKRKLKILTIGKKSNIFKIINHKVLKSFQYLELKYKNKIYKLKINIYGSIQVKNLLMAILASKVCGLKIENIFNKINKIKSVEGRLQLIKTLPNQSKVFLDYAHTPDALNNALLSLKEHFQKKITIVFGCGGDRDKTKRRLMGNIATKNCDRIIVTNDNPRNENPKKIRNDIIKGLKNIKAIEIGNRKKAIIYALENSDPHDIILIAGKGHETYQDIGKRKIFFSDEKIIKNYKNKNISSNIKDNNLKHNAKVLKNTLKLKKNYFFNGVSINSRNIKKNNLFIAIKGKRNDGHKFLNMSLKNGANYCVVSKNIRKKKFIKVNNTMKFLNDYAKNKRDSLSARFIAITGSSGKTTVKTMLGSILGKYSKTYFSPHSYNNQYGVPLSISNMNPDHNYGVFEVGMNKFNEILKLSKLVKPHIGVITNVSEAHLENFGNLKNIAKAKSEIIYNINKDGTIILNRDDKFFNYFKKIAKKNKIKVKSFGYSNKADVKFLSLRKIKNLFLLKFSIKGRVFILKLNNGNKNYIMNILSCISVIDELCLPIIKVKNFFKTQPLLKGRGKINKIKTSNKNFFLIDESYNANPSSVKSAIDNFSSLRKKNKKKYFLFGDMLELGKNSNIYHKKISKFINNSDIDKTFVYGNKAFVTYKFLKKRKKGEVVKNLKSFKSKIKKIMKNGDYLMIKGSNATKLHNLSKELIKERTNAI